MLAAVYGIVLHLFQAESHESHVTGHASGTFLRQIVLRSYEDMDFASRDAVSFSVLRRR